MSIKTLAAAGLVSGGLLGLFTAAGPTFAADQDGQFAVEGGGCADL